jgi:hypothetical protein
VSLLLTGRREDRRWKREVLEEAMVSLFDASFGCVDGAAFDAAKDGKELREYKDRALDAHGAQLEALTRLRFLATPQVLKIGIRLHDIEDQLYSIVVKEPLESVEWPKLEAE